MAKRVSEILADVELKWARWSSTHRIGVAEYVPDDNTIRIHIREDDYYEVDLDRCRDAYQFTAWLFHLNDKTWFTGEIIKDFLECYSLTIQERHGIDPRTYLRTSHRPQDDQV